MKLNYELVPDEANPGRQRVKIGVNMIGTPKQNGEQPLTANNDASSQGMALYGAT